MLEIECKRECKRWHERRYERRHGKRHGRRYGRRRGSKCERTYEGNNTGFGITDKFIVKAFEIPFIVVPSDIDEESLKLAGNPWDKAEKLALAKAQNVAEKVKAQNVAQNVEGKVQNRLILGADTIVVLDGVIFGKPKDRHEAYSMLKSLSGRYHEVITGIAVINAQNGFYKTAHEKTKVFFINITDDDIWAYISTGEPEGKAGAYAIQGKGALFIKKIEGCYTNVVGLPMVLVSSLLKEFS